MAQNIYVKAAIDALLALKQGILTAGLGIGLDLTTNEITAKLKPNDGLQVDANGLGVKVDGTTITKNESGQLVASGSGGGAVDSVNGKTGVVVLDGGDINVDASASSPVTIEAALNSKQDVEAGKGLSSNDYTTADKNKVSALTGNYEELVFTLAGGSTTTIKVATMT